MTKNVLYYRCRSRVGLSPGQRRLSFREAHNINTLQALRDEKGDSGPDFSRVAASLSCPSGLNYERSIYLAEKLKIIPLGGLDEIGKNITVLEYGKDMIVIDCGVGFPEEDMYGVDLVIPDFSYLVANQKKLRGFFITHGHEDHIGSIPYAMQQVSCPIH